MKITRETTYNLSIKPFIKEQMNSWTPPNFLAMTLWPIFAGESRFSRNYWVSHRHFENLDLQLILEGNLKISYNDETALLNPGELILIPPGAHRLETGPAGFCRKKCIGFCGMALKILIKTLELDHFTIIPNFLSQDILNLHDQISQMLLEKKEENVSGLSILAYTFLMKVAAARQTEGLPGELISCRHFIEQNLFQKLTLDDMSQETKCSKATLTRLFKKFLHTTPVQFLIRQRINYARNMLLNTSTSIKEIASLCGYQNQLYFSNDFKKHIGCSPREFCRQYRNGESDEP